MERERDARERCAERGEIESERETREDTGPQRRGGMCACVGDASSSIGGAEAKSKQAWVRAPERRPAWGLTAVMEPAANWRRAHSERRRGESAVGQ